jgi:hypothetical protein
MTVREWVASAGFVAFMALKLTEILVPLESWPFSNVAMFSERRPAHVLPQRIHIYGRRDGQWVELTSRDLSLTDDELGSRLRSSPDLRLACGEIVAANNPRLGVDAAMVMVEDVPRPGTDARPEWHSAPCPL